MRKNTRDTFDRWLAGKPSPPSVEGKAIWTDGEGIYSYGTCLYAESDDRRVLNRTTYSVTTTIHQNGLARLMRSTDGLRYVDNLDRGVGPRTLLARAEVSWRTPAVLYWPVSDEQ